MNKAQLAKKLLVSVLCSSILGTAYIAGASEVQPTASYELEQITVTGEKVPIEPTTYVKSKANVGVLGVKEVAELPFDVVNISEKAIENFGSSPEGLSAVLSLDPSVNASANTSADQVTIRGISINGHAMYLNNIPGLFGQYKMATNFIESVDIMSGPGTGYNGTSYSTSAGGTVNLQSKRATEQPLTNFTISYLGGSSVEEKLDISRRFGKNNRYGLRINTLHIDGEINLPGANLNQKNIFINLDQKTNSSESNLLIGYLSNHQNARQKSASFNSKTVSELPKVPSGKTNLAPDWAYDDHDNWMLTFNHNQKLSKSTSIFFNAGYHREDWYGYLSGSPTVFNNAGDFTSSFSNYPLALTKRYAQIGFKGKFEVGKVKNEYILSLDKNWYDYWIDSKSTDPEKFTGNLYDKINWDKPFVPTVELPHKTTTAQMRGWAIFDTLYIDNDKLQLTLGLHGHRAQVHSFDAKTGKLKSSVDSDGICPTFGIMYKITPQLSVYANHSENFAMGTLVGNNYANAGSILDPSKTKQNEIGFKYKNGDFLHTLSAYDINIANNIDVYVSGESKPYLRTDGEQRNKGIEYKLVGELNKRLNIIGGFMYLDAKQEKTAKGVNDGLRVNGAPNWSATLGADYKLNKDLAVLLRGVYAGTSTINNERLNVPAYMKFDLGLKYKTQINNTPVTLTAMCYNLTNKNYWQASAGSSSLYIGTPRTFTLSAMFEF